MATKIYIDGQEGTTGLRILQRLENRSDIQLIKIDESLRKDVGERRRLINQSDITFLCLPDSAAIEAVSLVDEGNNTTRIIDASTAHRTNPAWAYGFPELSPEHRAKIKASRRVANPGCYASGFIALVYPLVKSGIIPKDYPLISHAVSGYSGAGKSGIAQYEGENRPRELDSPRQYALTQEHKHIKEMMTISGLDTLPIFNPIVDDYYNGMFVTVSFHSKTLPKKVSLSEVQQVISEHYKDEYFVNTSTISGGFIGANNLMDTNMMELFVTGNDDRIVLTARFDNLGKGASGAAVQSMNIMMGVDEKTGLV